MTHSMSLLNSLTISLMSGGDEPATQAPRKDDMPTRSPEDYQPPAERPPAEKAPPKSAHLHGISRSFAV